MSINQNDKTRKNSDSNPNIRKAAQLAWIAFASCSMEDRHMDSVFVDIFTYIDGDITLYKTICLN